MFYVIVGNWTRLSWWGIACTKRETNARGEQGKNVTWTVAWLWKGDGEVRVTAAGKAAAEQTQARSASGSPPHVSTIVATNKKICVRSNKGFLYSLYMFIVYLLLKTSWDNVAVKWKFYYLQYLLILRYITNIV